MTGGRWCRDLGTERQIRSNSSGTKVAFPNLLQSLLADVPAERTARVLFHDEASFGRITARRPCWAPAPLRPHVRVDIIREFTTVLASVSPKDGRLYAMLYRGWVDTDVMNAYLRATQARFRRNYCILFTDGAGCHTSHDLNVPSRMHIELLPPYSPELNPAEGLWSYLHENFVGNHLFSSLDEVEKTLSRGLCALRDSPTLVRSLTCFDWIKAAILTYK